MKDVLTASEARDMLSAVAEHIIANVDALTEVDKAIGDGDHGVGMRRGFNAVLDEMKKMINPVSPAAVFKDAGTAIMAHTGGAAGVVFGTLFRAGSSALEGVTVVDGAGLAGVLRLGLDAIEKRGGAKPGQKTMIDALDPAAAAAETAAAEGLPKTIQAAFLGASNGCEATKGMIATTGKARTLGERSLGHPDPGAVSCVLILQAMRDYIEA